MNVYSAVLFLVKVNALHWRKINFFLFLKWLYGSSCFVEKFLNETVILHSHAPVKNCWHHML